MVGSINGVATPVGVLLGAGRLRGATAGSASVVITAQLNQLQGVSAGVATASLMPGAYGTAAGTSSVIGRISVTGTTAVVSRVDVLDRETIFVVFSEPMLNDAALNSLASYVVTGGMTVKSVLTSGTTASEIVLVVSQATPGTSYTLTVATSLTAATNIPINGTARTGTFVGRRTKMDNVLRRLPALYARSHGSTLRAMLQAISREDDAVGGSQDEYS